MLHCATYYYGWIGWITLVWGKYEEPYWTNNSCQLRSTLYDAKDYVLDHTTMIMVHNLWIIFANFPRGREGRIGV